MRQKDNIVKCAIRMTEKLAKSKYHKMNGQYPSSVQVEIERMLKHCRDSNQGADDE